MGKEHGGNALSYDRRKGQHQKGERVAVPDQKGVCCELWNAA